MKNREIKSLADLQLEISRVKNIAEQQEQQLINDAKMYVDQFSILNIITKTLKPSNLLKADNQTNLIGSIMSLILPVFINKTILAKSGFLTKSISALISSKLGQTINMENIMNFYQKIKVLISSNKKKDTLHFEDYGIPPDSETY